MILSNICTEWKYIMENTQIFKPEDWSIKVMLDSLFVIPVYQRPYSWESPQISELLKDAFKSYEVYKKNMDSDFVDVNSILFAGTIYVRPLSAKRNKIIYDVVDGQQRITSFLLILMAILNKLNAIKDLSQDEYSTVINLRQLLWKTDNFSNISKESPVLSLGSIEKQFFKNMLNELFEGKDLVNYLNKKINNKECKMLNLSEQNLLRNFLQINNFLDNYNISSKNELKTFFDFFGSNVRVISIRLETSLSKMFEYFESINGKGKKLEEIDLIKSYLFQNIKEEDYETYLNNWGNLITQTKDCLMDYLTVYIRGLISYSEKGLKTEKIKKLINNELAVYFDTDSTSETTKKFIDDLLDKVGFYSFVKNINDAINNAPVKTSDLIKSYILMSCNCGYNNDKPIFFKLLLLLKDGKCSIQDVERLVEITFKYLFTCQTIGNIDGKKTTQALKNVQKCILKSSLLSENIIQQIENIYKKSVLSFDIDDSRLKQHIPNVLIYTNREIVKTVLAYLNFYDEIEKKENYSNLIILLSKLWNIVHCDHILPRNPDKDDPSFQYWSSNKENNVYFKDGQDFYPKGTLKYSKDVFEKERMHVLGNLRLEYQKDNISKGNSLIPLRDLGNQKISTYKQVQNRASVIIGRIIDSGLVLSKDTIGDVTNIHNEKETIEITYQMLDSLSDDITSYADVESFSYKKEHHMLEKQNYTCLLDDFVYFTYCYDKDKLYELACSEYKPFRSDRVFIANSKKKLNSPRTIEVNKNIFIDVNHSGLSIIKIVFKLAKAVGLDPNDITVRIRK